MSRFLSLPQDHEIPEASAGTLDGVKKQIGFAPNLFRAMSRSPALINAYNQLADLFKTTRFTAVERQVVALSASYLNECHYCLAAHSAAATAAKMPGDVLAALRENRPLPDAKLEALRLTTRALVEKRGWLSEEDVATFETAGYDREQLLDLVLGVGLKTLSNYTNHLADTPLDRQFSRFEWHPAD